MRRRQWWRREVKGGFIGGDETVGVGRKAQRAPAGCRHRTRDDTRGGKGKDGRTLDGEAAAGVCVSRQSREHEEGGDAARTKKACRMPKREESTVSASRVNIEKLFTTEILSWPLRSPRRPTTTRVWAPTCFRSGRGNGSYPTSRRIQGNG